MTFEKYIQEMKLNHRRPNTIENTRIILSDLDRFKKLDSCKEDDIKNYCEKYVEQFQAKHGRKMEESTIISRYAIIKKYYKWCGHPEKSKWMNTRTKMKKLNPSKLLTPAEIQNMLRIWPNERDRCMLAIAYESGMRIGELLSLRIEDLVMKDGECIVRIPDNSEGDHINAKTGSRTLVLIESLPYIEKYLNVRNADDTRLFPIKRGRAHYILKDMAAKAGIEKDVFWHLIRHTRANEMAQAGMQETAMKKRFGWTEDSGMIKRYTSLTDNDADNSYREALGLSTKKREFIVNPIAKRCSKCGKLIDTGDYCPQCAEIQRLNEANTKTRMENSELKSRLDGIEKLLSSWNGEILSKTAVVFEPDSVTIKGTVNKDMSETELQHLKEELEGIVKKAEKQKS